jgi:hypothetical protein
MKICLLQSVTKLETTTNLLSGTVEEIIYIRDALYKTSGLEADAVKQKILLMFQ